MPRRLLGRFAAVVALAVSCSVGAAWFADAAGAHSALEESSPASGAVLDSAPREITLRFNEPVSLPDGAVRLLDAEGGEVDIGTPGVVDDLVTVEIGSGLADGSYVVAWKVMSEDSHPVSGAFTFAVGAPSTSADGVSAAELVARAQPDTTGAQLAVDLAAGLAYGGVLAAIGAAWFLVGPASGAPRPRVGAIRRWALGASAAGTAGLIGAVVAEYLLIDEVTAAIVAQCLTGAAGLSLLAASVRWDGHLTLAARRWITAAATLLAVVAFVLVGHTRTATPIALTMGADLAHLAAAAVWTGGLVALLLFLHSGSRSQPSPDDAAVVARFSSGATVSIVVVMLAGAVLGWRIVGSWDALTGTDYGVVLLVKVGLFTVLAAIGAFNRFRLVGRDPGATLRRTLLAEALIVVVIIGITGVLTSTSPNESTTGGAGSQWVTGTVTCEEAAAMEGMPGMEDMDHTACVGTTTSSQVPFDPTAGAGGDGGAVRASAAFGDGTALVTISPGKVGTNTIAISLTDAAGGPIEPSAPPTVELRLREQQLGPITATAERVGPGAYRATQDFVLPGTWEINVSAVVSDFEQPQAIVSVDIVG